MVGDSPAPQSASIDGWAYRAEVCRETGRSGNRRENAGRIYGIQPTTVNRRSGYHQAAPIRLIFIHDRILPVSLRAFCGPFGVGGDKVQRGRQGRGNKRLTY